MRFTSKLKKKVKGSCNKLTDNEHLDQSHYQEIRNNTKLCEANFKPELKFTDCKYAKFVPRNIGDNFQHHNDLIALHDMNTNDAKHNRLQHLQIIAKFIFSSAYCSRSRNFLNTDKLSKKLKKDSCCNCDESDEVTRQMLKISKEFKKLVKKTVKNTEVVHRGNKSYQGGNFSELSDYSQQYKMNLIQLTTTDVADNNENIKGNENFTNLECNSNLYLTCDVKRTESLKVLNKDRGKPEYHMREKDVISKFKDYKYKTAEVNDCQCGTAEVQVYKTRTVDPCDHQVGKTMIQVQKPEITVGKQQKVQPGIKMVQDQSRVAETHDHQHEIGERLDHHSEIAGSHDFKSRLTETHNLYSRTTEAQGHQDEIAAEHSHSKIAEACDIQSKVTETHDCHSRIAEAYKNQSRITETHDHNSGIAEAHNHQCRIKETHYPNSEITEAHGYQSKIVKMQGHPDACNHKMLEIHYCNRFGEINENHCNAVFRLANQRLNGKSGTCLEVCVFIQENVKEIRELLELRLDLTHKCLNTYFFPGKNLVSVSVQKDLKKFLNRTVFQKASTVKDLFGERHCFDDDLNIKAVVMVSHPISALLRHQDICLLDTLQVILGIESSMLLVLKALGKN